MLFLLGNIFPVLVMGLFASSVNNCRGSEVGGAKSLLRYTLWSVLLCV
jgi:hypothetical protein